MPKRKSSKPGSQKQKRGRHEREPRSSRERLISCTGDNAAPASVRPDHETLVNEAVGGQSSSRSDVSQRPATHGPDNDVTVRPGASTLGNSSPFRFPSPSVIEFEPFDNFIVCNTSQH